MSSPLHIGATSGLKGVGPPFQKLAHLPHMKQAELPTGTWVPASVLLTFVRNPTRAYYQKPGNSFPLPNDFGQDIFSLRISFVQMQTEELFCLHARESFVPWDTEPELKYENI